MLKSEPEDRDEFVYGCVPGAPLAPLLAVASCPLQLVIIPSLPPTALRFVGEGLFGSLSLAIFHSATGKLNIMMMRLRILRSCTRHARSKLVLVYAELARAMVWPALFNETGHGSCYCCPTE